MNGWQRHAIQFMKRAAEQKHVQVKGGGPPHSKIPCSSCRSKIVAYPRARSTDSHVLSTSAGTSTVFQALHLIRGAGTQASACKVKCSDRSAGWVLMFISNDRQPSSSLLNVVRR